jgi:nicotinate-nucleotide adenylyltransferase
MGADNLRQFHRWRHWRLIADLVPIVVVDRPGSTLRAISSRAGAALARWRAPERDAARFAAMRPPALLFLHGRRSDLSSTALRRAGRTRTRGVLLPPAARARPRRRSLIGSRPDRLSADEK